MNTLFALIVIFAVVSVLIILIDKIPLGPPILKDLAKTFVILVAILVIWPMLTGVALVVPV